MIENILSVWHINSIKNYLKYVVKNLICSNFVEKKKVNVLCADDFDIKVMNINFNNNSIINYFKMSDEYYYDVDDYYKDINEMFLFLFYAHCKWKNNIIFAKNNDNFSSKCNLIYISDTDSSNLEKDFDK